MIIEKINKNKASEIIENRKPEGLFYYKDGNKYIAIDNKDGHAWTEEFEWLEDTIIWLNHGVYKEDIQY